MFSKSFFWVFLLFLIQNLLAYVFPGNAPALVLTGVICCALSEGVAFGALAGFWGGFWLDLLTLGRPGYYMGSFAVTGFLSGFLSKKVFQDGIFTKFGLPSLCFYLIMLVELCVLKAQIDEPITFAVVAEAFHPWPLFLTAVCSPWVFRRLRNYGPRYRQMSSRRI